MTPRAERKGRQPAAETPDEDRHPSRRHASLRPRAGQPQRGPDGRFRRRRRRRTRCACGEMATRVLTVHLLSAANLGGDAPAGLRYSRPAWYLLRLCEDCYAIEKQALALLSDRQLSEDA